jgi:proton-translocating NADH-quinone oxidoreductase chain N
MDSLFIKSFVPEIFFSVCILIFLFLNAYIINNIKYNYPIITKELISQSFFSFLILFLLLLNNKIEGFFSNFIFLNDYSNTIIKVLIIFIAIISILPIAQSFIAQKLNFFEFFIVYYIVILSSLLLVCSSDMLSIYLIIEMQALSFYVLSSFKRNSSFSAEAGLKYFILGSFISGLFLFGCSIIYGILGTLNFNNLNLLLSIPINNSLYYNALLFGIICITVVFLFKISCAPFHFWSPDVYEGSPLAATIIFSIIPQLSIFYLLIKWLSIVTLFKEITSILFFCGFISIFVGSFFALRQKRLKKLIVYSSISQIGIVVASLSNISLETLNYIFFFIIIYVITSALIWSNVSLLFSFQNKLNLYFDKLATPIFFSNLIFLSKRNKALSILNALIFFSLAGIPPLVGFFSKTFLILLLLQHSINNSFLILLPTTVSVFYYLKLIKIIFFENNNVINLTHTQIIVPYFYFEFECIILSTFIFTLVFLFFKPNTLLILCYLITANFFFF